VVATVQGANGLERKQQRREQVVFEIDETNWKQPPNGQVNRVTNFMLMQLDGHKLDNNTASHTTAAALATLPMLIDMVTSA
jgi:hypothetical protein